MSILHRSIVSESLVPFAQQHQKKNGTKDLSLDLKSIHDVACVPGRRVLG